MHCASSQSVSQHFPQFESNAPLRSSRVAPGPTAITPCGYRRGVTARSGAWWPGRRHSSPELKAPRRAARPPPPGAGRTADGSVHWQPLAAGGGGHWTEHSLSTGRHLGELARQALAASENLACARAPRSRPVSESQERCTATRFRMRSLGAAAAVASLASLTAAQVPNRPPTWLMNASTMCVAVAFRWRRGSCACIVSSGRCSRGVIPPPSPSPCSIMPCNESGFSDPKSLKGW